MDEFHLNYLFKNKLYCSEELLVMIHTTTMKIVTPVFYKSCRVNLEHIRYVGVNEDNTQTVSKFSKQCSNMCSIVTFNMNNTWINK